MLPITASVVALRGLILICLLQLSVQEDVNKVALAKMIKYFDDNVQPKPGAQYAIAIRLTKKQCTDEKFSVMSVFSRPDAKIVKDKISKGQICELCTKLKNVIAARPKSEDPNDHPEYRLLFSEGKSVGNSPMDKLLEKVDKNTCVVFYTYNSPRVNESMSVKKNILRGLSNWKNKQKEGIKVFVFQNMWEKDVTENLTNEIQKIDVIVPLYQCPRAEEMNCFKCRGQQATSYCQTVPDKTYY
nr:uncharacterized protein LOC129438964 [Misgurnus anguillicaudatus]